MFNGTWRHSFSFCHVADIWHQPTTWRHVYAACPASWRQVLVSCPRENDKTPPHDVNYVVRVHGHANTSSRRRVHGLANTSWSRPHDVVFTGVCHDPRYDVAVAASASWRRVHGACPREERDEGHHDDAEVDVEEHAVQGEGDDPPLEVHSVRRVLLEQSVHEWAQTAAQVAHVHREGLQLSAGRVRHHQCPSGDGTVHAVSRRPLPLVVGQQRGLHLLTLLRTWHVGVII